MYPEIHQYWLKDLDEAHIGDWDLNMALHNYLSVLDENYGENRNVHEDDGGFAIIIEDEKQLQEASAYIDLEEDIYEYIEEINESYICMLKLCNNEFTIMIYIRKVLCTDEILECLYSNDESVSEQ